MQRFDGVGAVDDPADLGAVVQERRELGPVVVPQADDRRVLLTPGSGELAQAFFGGLLAGGDVNGSQVTAMASQSARDASRKVFLIRCSTQVWVTASGQVASIASGRPFSPSHTTMHTSSTPRFLISVSTCNQNFAPSPPLPTHRPRMSRSPSTVTPSTL